MNVSTSNDETTPAHSPPRLHRHLAVQRALDVAHAAGQPVGLVYLDLDRFHLINARWGRAAGDTILTEIAARLASRLPSPASVVAADGAAFVVVLPNVDTGVVAETASALLAAVREPMEIDAETVEVVASAGYVHTDHDADVGIDIFERAYLACRSAKLSSRGTALAYAERLHADAERSRRYEDGLRRAIAKDSLVLHFQPVIDLRDGTIASVEALVRWEEPDEGLLPPDRFLPIAEAAGMMVALGDSVLQRAIALVQRWKQRYGRRAPQVWVNLASAQIAAGDHVYDVIREHLDNGDLRPEQIGFEVTESALLEDIPEASRLLRKLRGLGIQIALDDFGTGYSSLAYLRQLPVTAVKVDREFTRGVADSLADEAIVEAVIDLAHALGLRVIAEGVEDEHQHAALVRMSADEAQGFYFGAPCTSEELEQLLDDWTESADAASRVSAAMPGFGSPRSRLLLTALDTAHGSILVTAADRTPNPAIVYVNAAFEADIGFRARDVLGQDLSMLLGGLAPEDQAWMAEVVTGHDAATREIRFVRANGTGAITEVALSPILDSRGVHTHWLFLLRDLSEARRRARLTDFAALIARRTLDDDRAELFRSQSQFLEPLAELFDADLAYLDLIDLDGRTLTPLGDWTPGGDGEPIPGRPIDLDEFTNWIERLSTMDTPVGSITEEVGTPWAGEVGAHFGLHPGRNVYAPLRVGTTLLGVLGMNKFRAERPLEEFELATFRQIASTLASLVWRLRSDDAIRRSNARLLHFDEIGSGIGEWALNLMDPAQLVSGLEARLGTIGEALNCTSMTLEKFDSTLLAKPVEWHATDGPADGGDHVYCQPLNVLGQRIGEITARRGAQPDGWRADELVLLRRASLSLASLLRRLESLTDNAEIEQWMAAVLDETNELMVVVDQSGTVRFINGVATQRLGFNVADVVGRSITEFIHPDDVAIATSRLTAMFGDAQRMNTTLRLLDAEGNAGWWEISRGARLGNLNGRVVICRDVTARTTEEVLAARRVERLQHALNVSQMALDLEADEFIARLDEVCAAIQAELDVDQAIVVHFEPTGGATVLARSGAADAAPERTAAAALDGWIAALGERRALLVTDRGAVTEGWADQQELVLGPSAASLAVPMIIAGAPIGALAVTMALARRDWTADDATYLRMVTETIAHVVERSRVVEALRASEAKFRLLSDAAADVVLLVDADGYIRYASPSSKQLLGHEPEQLIDTRVERLAHPAHPALLTVLPERDAVEAVTVEGQLRRPDGTSVWVSNSASAIAGIGVPGISGVRMSLRDISERKRLEAALEWRATHDPLTGLVNVTGLRQRLVELAGSVGDDEQFSVLMLDLDGFKAVNDNRGHAFGDSVLRHVAHCLQALTRPVDTLARTGGDEFVMLCLATDVAESIEIAERLIVALATLGEFDGFVLGLGASIGIAHQRGPGGDPERLLQDADRAMYSAKRSGRGRVLVA